MKLFGCKTGIFVLVIFLAFLNHACSQHDEYGEILLRAERLMQERPDSSLRLLENDVSPGKLPKEQHANWCLLVTQARDKNYIQHTSDSLISLAAGYYMKHNNPGRRILAYYYMGRVNHDMNNVPKAQEYYLEALKAGESSDNYALIGRIHSNLGVLYTYQAAYDLAMPHLKEADACLRKTDESGGLSFVSRDIGRVYTLQNQYDSALTYYRQALLYADPVSRFSVLNEIGLIYTENGDYETAYYYIWEALKQIYDQADYHPVYLTLGKLFYKMGEADSAKYYLNKSMASSLPETRAGSYYYLYHLAKANRRWEDYALFQEKYEVLRDTIMSRTYTSQTQKMQHLYNYQEAENRVVQEKLAHAIAARNNIILALVIIFLAGCMIGYYLYSRATKRRKEEMEEELFQYFEIRRNEEYNEQIKINTERIEELERKSYDKAVKDKDVLRLEKKLLELENKQLSRMIIEKEEKKKKLESSGIYDLFAREPVQKIANSDKETLMSLIDETYPGFRSGIFDLDSSISPEDLFMCYLIKANVKGIRISRIMARSRQAVSMRRKRLAVIMLGEESSPKSLDHLIQSL